ncbi:MAG: hypothetical protein ACR2GQ_00665 [Gemmatimonadota bacterium]
MGETRVDLLRLLEDLRDAYPGSMTETIVTETVANALDAGSREIRLIGDPVARTFTAIDGGRGMGRKALSGYHDLAVTTKLRGRGIGFAGVGIKLGLLVADEVVTETKTARAKAPLATSWNLSSRTRAPWRRIEPQGLLDPGASGTAVRLYLSNPLSELVDQSFLETTLLRHFEPLFDSTFDGILADQYPDGVRFVVNGRVLPRSAPDPDRAPIEVRVGRQRKPSGVGFLVQDGEAAEEDRGIAISTMGKVIHRGWDWLGLAPHKRADVRGLIEVPSLSETLTLNKADFIRSGSRGATFLAYRKALQEAVSTQLEAWGESADAPRPRRRSGSLERDLRSVLSGLSADYPLLATLVDRRPGGQRRLPLGGAPSLRGTAPGVDVTAETADAAEPGEPGANDEAGGANRPPGEPSSPESPPPESGREEAPEPQPEPIPDGGLPGAASRKRRAHLGLRIQFESWPDDAAIGRLIESTVWVNDAHPAYRRAVASRSEGYHVAVAVALALAPLAVEPAAAQEFLSDFLAHWGDAGKNGGAGAKKRRG